MAGFFIKLKSINDVKEFVRIANLFENDIDLVSGRYTVDAKSIMGIFSLDLSNPIQVEVFDGDVESLLKDMEPFIVEQNS